MNVQRDNLITYNNQKFIYNCSPGALKIKGTASSIYPIPPGYQGLLPGGYIYPPGSGGLTSWGIYISPRKSAYHFLGDIYIAQEMLAKREVKLLPFLPAQLKKYGEEASQRSEAELEERLNVIALYY